MPHLLIRLPKQPACVWNTLSVLRWDGFDKHTPLNRCHSEWWAAASEVRTAVNTDGGRTTVAAARGSVPSSYLINCLMSRNTYQFPLRGKDPYCLQLGAGFLDVRPVLWRVVSRSSVSTGPGPGPIDVVSIIALRPSPASEGCRLG